MDFEHLTIKKAQELLEEGKTTSVALTTHYLDVIKEKNGDINAYLEVFNDALDQAKRADEARAKGGKGALLGIPLAIKDNILIKGHIASASSKILGNYVASYDATGITKLKKEGAVFIGRTNMDEFAMGSSTENSAYGVTKNPHDTSRVPGGSSGGSAAAVAMGGAIASLGTDTGGSVRQPAALCGLVGLKPTYGAISRSGIIAMGSSLDQIGPLTRTVADNEILFNALKGEDALDSTTIKDTTWATLPNKEPKVIGVPWHFFEKGLDPAVEANFKESIEKLKSLGYTIKDISLPNAKYSLPVYYVLMPAEVSTNLARFDGVRYGLHVDGENLLADYMKSRAEGFGKETRRRIILGAYVLSAGYADEYYYKAVAVREGIKADFRKAFEEVDAIATPTVARPAFKIGEKTNDPLTMYLEDIFTTPANIAGIPALSVPSGTTNVEGKDLPLGIQFMAKYCNEATLFSIGKKFLGE